MGGPQPGATPRIFRDRAPAAQGQGLLARASAGPLRLVEAAEAQAIGLIHEVAGSDAFEGRIGDLAQMVASYAPLTLRAMKEALRRLRERMIRRVRTS